MKKLAKIVLFITFVPYLLILVLFAIYGAATVWALYLFTCYIPVIPACAVYQLMYLIRSKSGKVRSIPRKKFVTVCSVILALIVIPVLVYQNEFYIEQMVMKYQARAMYRDCDEKIDYDKHDIHCDGLFDIEEQYYSCVMLDYDRMKTGVIAAGSFEEYFSVQMEPAQESAIDAAVGGYLVQAVIPLTGEGSRLISFSTDETLLHRTIALVLEMKDGTMYIADKIQERDTGFDRFTGLNRSEYFVGENVHWSEMKMREREV